MIRRRPHRRALLVSVFILATACSSGRGNPPGGAGGADAGAGDEDPDGGQPTNELVICPNPTPPASSGTCDVAPGQTGAVLIQGTVLGPDATYEHGTVLYQGDTISCVGCDCAEQAAGATVITCPDAVISPALINPHDHISFTEGSPIDHGTTRYDHRHAWRGSLSTPANPHGTSPTSPGMQWGEVRMLLGGATSMVGSGSADNLVRNLDRLSSADQAFGFQRVRFETFSLGDSGEQFRDNCGWNYRLTELEAAEESAFLPHVAEGVDSYAAEEFRCQSTSFDNGQDFTENNSTHIHGIGLGAGDYYRMARDGTRLLWSPRSNISLYGHTAHVTTFDNLGGVIALGTDWTYSGSANMLRELACADEFNRDYLAGHFNDDALWRMATINAAIATGTDDLIGSLAADKLADIAIFAAGPGLYHRAVLEADNQDVVLVLRAGQVMLGEPHLVSGLGESCETVDVCGQDRALCLQREIGKSYDQLEADVSSGTAAYPAMFCGKPAGEPTCVPSREGEFSGALTSTDGDGDGIADASDNCPSVFNPVRPIDGGTQADHDGDGEGDACDPSPVGSDVDGDGIVNQDDNCPFDANDDQDDLDSDAKGDICDFCPDASNPTSVCGIAPPVVASIADVQMGTIEEGATVTIEGAVVTGVWANGAWVQDPNATAWGGIHVFTGPNAGVSLGQMVDVTGVVFEYFDDTELDDAEITVTGSAAVPTPIAVTVAEAATEAYEGMLVELTDIGSIDMNYDCSVDHGSCADQNLWQVNDSILVYNRLYQDDDWTSRMGDAPVIGVMMTRFERRRIMPRTANDLGN